VTSVREHHVLCGGLLAAATVGVGIAVYLTVAHAAGATLACNTGGLVDCEAVTSSGFSVVWGSQIPITIPGIVWFAVSGLLALAALSGRDPGWLAPAHAVWALGALLFVFYLVYAELVVISRICAWCTAVHVLVLLTFVLALRRLQLRAMAPPTR
jgi:uncharacterized membrane protein